MYSIFIHGRSRVTIYPRIPTNSGTEHVRVLTDQAYLKNAGEWLKYTVFTPKSGLFDVSVRYATLANSTALSITVDDGSDRACEKNSEGTALYRSDLPSSGSWDVWVDTDPASPYFVFDFVLRS